MKGAFMQDLEVKNLSFSLGKRAILQDISLSVKRGEFVGIIGPNGSGKSTLLKTIYRVLQPQAGEISVLGRRLQDISLSESARLMAVMGQFHKVNFDFTVEDMVMMGRIPHQGISGRLSARDRQAVERALSQAGIEKLAKRRFAALSGGEQQRVVLARALAQEPRLLLLDEPTNHLDIRYQMQIMEIAASLGVGVLAVLHDLNLAAMYCQRLYVLKAGRLMAAGTPCEILTPKLINDVYDVHCEVLTGREGRPVIVYGREKMAV
ncbi:iron complex transport system ATP-binding protein [Selenomonas ruminantium]|uniref:Iron complex transport system ATP-binding protein n=2 Tax=Selenomonas ruminantium TaxID=971 RepID=A0A1H0UY23_SELRU|nr:iron complex transport system ATP-binding protein [Selenomonas ruminantium]